jgi:hypothetical protein
VVTELEDFLRTVVPAQEAADNALINGDPEPRLRLWSDHDPVTLFGAERSATGRAEHTNVSFDGGPVRYVRLRVTHVYRREDGAWKIVHRHGDGLETGSP